MYKKQKDLDGLKKKKALNMPPHQALIYLKHHEYLKNPSIENLITYQESIVKAIDYYKNQSEVFTDTELDAEINKTIKKLEEKNIALEKELESKKGTNNELANAHEVIKKLRRKNRNKYKSKEEMIFIIDKTRKKNGTPNWSAVGKEIGIRHETAKAWAKGYNIPI